MTTIFVRYDAAGYKNPNLPFQEFVDSFFRQLRQSDQIETLYFHDSSTQTQVCDFKGLQLKSGDFLYVPLISKTLVTKKDFIEEIEIALAAQAKTPGIRTVCAIGIEHVDTSILRMFPNHMETILNIIRLYSSISVLEQIIGDPTQNVERFADASFTRVHNESVVLNEMRQSQQLPQTIDYGGQYTPAHTYNQSAQLNPFSSIPSPFYDPAPVAHYPTPYDSDAALGQGHPYFSPNWNGAYDYPANTDFSTSDKASDTGARGYEESFVFIKRRKKIVVAKDGSGDFRSIDEAVRKADDESVIIVKPGVYDAPAIINKSISIVGDCNMNDAEAPKAELVINGRSPIRCLPYISDVKRVNSFIKIKNIIIKHSNTHYNDEVKSSCILVEDCELYLQECLVVGGSYCLYAGRNASVRTLGGVYTRANRANIIVDGANRIELNKTQVSKSEKDGIFVKHGAQPIIMNCRVSDNGGNGIIVHAQSGANIRNSQILQNGKCGVVVYIGAYCDITGSTISRNIGFGISLHFRCRGSGTDNILSKNKSGAKEINGEKKAGDYKTNGFIWIRNKEE